MHCSQLFEDRQNVNRRRETRVTHHYICIVRTIAKMCRKFGTLEALAFVLPKLERLATVVAARIIGGIRHASMRWEFSKEG
jgi:hypothetical protein